MLPLSESVLRQRIRMLRVKHAGDPRPIALRSPGGWSGGQELEVDDVVYRVLNARSSLELREGLLAAEGAPLVLVTVLEEKDVGDDVVARFARSKLFLVNLAETLCDLFKARSFDPSIRECAVLESLVEYAPPAGYPPVDTGALTRETVWQSFFEFGLRIAEGEPDLASLLRWTVDAEKRARYEGSSEQLKREVRSRVRETLRESGAAILAFVDGGHGEDALALASVCEVLFNTGETEADTQKLTEARVRFEQYHVGIDLSPQQGKELAEAARDLVYETRDPDPRLERALARADAILENLKVGGLAHLSSLTPRGARGRLDRLGEALVEAFEKRGAPDLRKCRSRLEAVMGHRDATQTMPMLRRAEMAVRLLRWLLRSPAKGPETLQQMARDYVREGAFVDWARDVLVSGGDASALSAAYVRLEKEAYQRRRLENRVFATVAAAWFESPGPGPVPIEDAGKRIVAPVLKRVGRVLLIVLDGMNWQVAHQLLADDDLRRIATAAWAKDLATPDPTLIATLPSVTELSRTSLLCGELVPGTQQTEKKGFAGQSAISAACSRDYPPLLFHKAELTEGGRGTLSSAVEDAIESSDTRIVAVVINAIDDDLMGAQQARSSWTVDRIRPLGQLLRAAFDAGRVVIVTSDHGHVYHRPGKKINSDGGADRWRPVTGEVGDGEIVVRGPRVRGGNAANEVVVPWDETIAYGAPKNGYHGGITPQELLAPIFVLHERWKEVPGLEPFAFDAPPWWRLDDWGEEEAPAAGMVSSEKPKTATLRPPEKRVTGRVCLEKFLSSPTYAVQRKLGGKHSPEDVQVRQVLEILLEEAGSMTEEAFARRIDVPLARLPGFVSRVQRILNVDGYEVFTHDRERNLVGLDEALLRKQFEI